MKKSWFRSSYRQKQRALRRERYFRKEEGMPVNKGINSGKSAFVAPKGASIKKGATQRTT
jgi:apolipoprotein N-acyltransferase